MPLLQVLTLEWSSGMESVRCTNRADLTLSGSFADLTLLPSPGTKGLNSKDEVFVLTNPGQLHLYNSDSLSTLTSQQKRTPSVPAVEFPVLVPMADPSLTVAKLIRLPSKSNSSKVLTEVTFLSACNLSLLSANLCFLYFFHLLISFILGCFSFENWLEAWICTFRLALDWWCSQSVVHNKRC